MQRAQSSLPARQRRSIPLKSVPVTTTIIGINALVFLAMAFTGSSPIEPTRRTRGTAAPAARAPSPSASREAVSPRAATAVGDREPCLATRAGLADSSTTVMTVVFEAGRQERARITCSGLNASSARSWSQASSCPPAGRIAATPLGSARRRSEGPPGMLTAAAAARPRGPLRWTSDVSANRIVESATPTRYRSDSSDGRWRKRPAGSKPAARTASKWERLPGIK